MDPRRLFHAAYLCISQCIIESRPRFCATDKIKQQQAKKTIESYTHENVRLTTFYAFTSFHLQCTSEQLLTRFHSESVSARGKLVVLSNMNSASSFLLNRGNSKRNRVSGCSLVHSRRKQVMREERIFSCVY